MFLLLFLLLFPTGILVILELPLYRNWCIAKKLQVPVIICPFPRYGLGWRILSSILERDPLRSWWKYLPFLRVFRPNWIFLEKHGICDDYGHVFAVATPDNCELYVADFQVAKQIFSQKKIFHKPSEITKKVDILGRSMASADGSDWNRHRRCTAAAFSENVNEKVWERSGQEASKISAEFLSRESVSDTRSSMIRISFTVLLEACMGVGSNDRAIDTDEPGPDVATAENDLTTLLRILRPRPTSIIERLWFLRRNKTDLFTARCERLSKFISALICYRRGHPLPRKDLLASMIEYKDEKMLTDEEIRGNLFLFMFAGHETTANTLLYIVYLLAIFPHWQSWAAEEIDAFVSTSGPNSNLTYREIFPRLKRLQAIMYETLRLYGPVVNIMRKTSSSQYQPEKVTTFDSRDVMIPGNVRINIMTPALHTDPEYWGPDSLSWNPGRWMKYSADNKNAAPGLASEKLDQSKIDHLLSWADGARVCPGKRFSQFEIIAVLLNLFVQARVEVVPGPSMNLDEAQVEALKAVQQSRTALTLQMQEPSSVRLGWCLR